MSSSKNSTHDIPVTDPIDILIFEKGLRINTIVPVKELDLLVIILNNGRVIKTRVSSFKLLKDASQEQLDKWELKLEGAALRWDELDEDLSLRGFIKNNVMGKVLNQLETSGSDLVEII
jgi:hypothetical protein